MPNYNTDLQSTITDLQNILTTINTLPEAGGGSGGSGSGMMCVSGNITITEGAKSSGVELATVSGLSFKPSYVAIIMAVGTSAVTSTSYYVLSSSYKLGDGLASAVTFSRTSSNMRGNCSGIYDEIILNDDGFTWKTEKSVYTSSTYRYIVVG